MSSYRWRAPSNVRPQGWLPGEPGGAIARATAPAGVEPRGEARSDIQIIFELARHLGLGAHFWDGNIEAAYRYQLGPSGVSLEALREQPGGVRVPQQTRHRKFAEQAAVCRGALTHRHGRSNCTRRRCWNVATLHCRSMKSR